MKRATSFLLAVLVALLLSACGAPATTATPAESADIPTATPSPTTTVTATPAPTATATPTATPTPVPTSLTSGLPYDGGYHPILVMIENMPAARPQSGIGQADIVYEAYMESKSVTRFLCVFNDKLPETVGPVRSCRIYFIDIAQEFDSLLAFFGGPKSSGHPADIYSKFRKTDIAIIADGIGNKYGKYYWRSKRRSAPHNVYTDLTKLAELLDPVEPASHFQYSADGLQQGDEVNSINIVYNKHTVDTTYEYDAKNSVYLRSIGGKPMMDALTDEQVTVTNVIVQQARHVSLGTSKGHINVKLTGEGKCDIFTGGKHVEGTWKRESTDDITRYYDGTGQEITLQPGNTWVQIIDKSTPFTYSK